MNPFNFNVKIDSRASLRRWILYTVTALILTSAFVFGFITVYVNSYNVMHNEPMDVLELIDDGVAFLKQYYNFWS